MYLRARLENERNTEKGVSGVWREVHWPSGLLKRLLEIYAKLKPVFQDAKYYSNKEWSSGHNLE